MTEAEKQNIRSRIIEINGTVEIIECTQSKVDPSFLLNIRGFDIKEVLKMEPNFLDIDSEHQHDSSVTSVGFHFEEPMHIGKLQRWINELINTKGPDLFRYKGVVNVMNHDKRMVFQGIHMLFTGGFSTPWGPHEKRETKFILIGRNLDQKELTEGFLACKEPPEPLRFSVGEEIFANVTGEFEKGVIIALWDEGNPYRIRLNKCGTEVYYFETF